jgi:hypothetical protein
MRAKTQPKQIQSSRNGITLLFVVSMIVLFLLMGTAFVVLAGDFMKSSKIRARFEFERFDQPEALVEKAIYDLLRGPDLNDLNSPLRFRDILSDQYGYGLKAFVDRIEFHDPTRAWRTRPEANFLNTPIAGQFVRIRLRDRNNTRGHGEKILYDPTVPAYDPTSRYARFVPFERFAESFDGTVISFINGTEKGMSDRVVAHEYDEDGDHWFWISINSLGKSRQAAVNRDYLATLVGSEVIINNRDFSGTGPAYDPSNSPGKLGAVALQPNRLGQPLVNEINVSRYVSDSSTNLPWTSVDAYSTLFLAGLSDDNRFVPSFHRESLVAVNGGSRNAGLSHIFSAFNLGVDLNGNLMQMNSANQPAIPLVDADNDGVPDSIWIDLDFPVKSHRGTFYKPLVAYKVVDLDGRLNLNAHGELTDAFPDYFITNSLVMRGTPAANLPRGQGMGPAEVSLRPMFGADFASYQNLVQNRYGNDGLVGSMRNGISGARVKMFGHPFNVVDWNNGDFGTVGNLFASSPMDVRGRFALGRPVQAVMNTSITFDNFVDANYPNFPNSMPVIDVRTSSLTTAEMYNSAYGLSFAPIPWNYGGSDDTPYTELELERVLRPSDIDVNLLAGRLWNIPTNPVLFWNDKRDIVTTASFEVPSSRFASLLFRKASVLLFNQPYENLTDAQRIQVRVHVDTHMAGLFAPELFQGLKMNINRPLGNGYDDDGDGVVDNPEEANAEVNLDQRNHFSARPASDFRMDLNQDRLYGNDQDARVVLARHLYCLAMLATDEYVRILPTAQDQLNYARTVAQWAVNVVDYRDPDSIMTRFHYDPFPFIDQNSSGNFWEPPMSGGNPDPNFVVWGMERPELLITETFAAHARRMQGDQTNPEQGLRPEPFAFIELYNPHTQNSLNQQFDSSLYANQGVDLSRRNNNNDPVWRIQIDRPRRGGPTSTPLRFVYFTDPGMANRGDSGATQEVFFTTQQARPVRPGSQAIIGTQGIPAGANRYRCYMGRLAGKTQADEIPDNLDLDNTSYIELDLSNAANPVVRRNFPTDNSRSVSTIIPVDRYRGQSNPSGNPRPFSISDPFGGYPDVSLPTVTQVPDGFRYITPFVPPLDPYPSDPTDHNRDDEDMAAVLQNDETTEGFRIVFLQRLANPAMPWDSQFNPYISVDYLEVDLLAFNGTRNSSLDPPSPGGSLQRNLRAESFERNDGENNGNNVPRLLWRSQRGQRTGNAPPLLTHYFDVDLRESLGRTNDLFQPADPNNQLAFPWLSWANRPFNSHLELMNVPFTSPLGIVEQFTVSQLISPYSQFTGTTLGGSFSHLLNFFHYQGNISPQLFSILEFVEVPSRFAGTTIELIPTQPSGGNPGFALNPFNTISRYREPGKININTIYDPRVFEAYMGGYASLNGGLNWNTFRSSRRLGQANENPFRPSFAGNLVPNPLPVSLGPESTLLRSRGAPLNSDLPLFDFVPNDPLVQLSMDADRSAYFRNAMRQRLGNITTERSSVFAIWVTVGFFECTKDGALLGVERELGIEEGTTRRHRGFYIFDRSIPVAFEPGKNHNIDQAILVRRIIE